MRKLTATLIVLLFCLSACQQKAIRIVATDKEEAMQLKALLEQGGCQTTFSGREAERTIYLGLPPVLEEQYQPLVDSLRDDGYLIVGDGRDLVLYGKGERGNDSYCYWSIDWRGF